jgi:hypothetical protein
MIPLDDDLLTALRAARPETTTPDARTPAATAMLSRILHTPRDPAPRLTRRRLLKAGIPAVAGAAAAAAVVATVTSSSPRSSSRPTAASVRTAVLDAFDRDGGDIVYSTRTIRRGRGPATTQQAWTYPAFPVPGQQVRYRLFQFTNGAPVEDTESIYVADAASTGLSLSTTQGPRTAKIIDVDYATRTWSRQQSHSVLLAGSLSPSLIRNQIKSGRFTVIGNVQLNGRQAVELTWTSSPGRLTLTTTLWVDAQTYQPLRSASTTKVPQQAAPLDSDSVQYRILPATPANLALLTPPIPPGFTRTPTSPHF